MESEDKVKQNKKLTGVLLFLIIGFGLSTAMTYYKSNSLEDTLETRKVIGDTLLELNQKQNQDNEIIIEQNKLIIEKLTNLENNSKKTGK